MNTQHYDEAVSWYSAALSLELAVPQGLYVKRSKAYIAGGSWEDALNDAGQVRPIVLHKPVLVDVSFSGDQA